MKIRKILRHTEAFRAEPTTPLHYDAEEEQPTVIRTPTLIYPVTTQEQAPGDRHPQCHAEVRWSPVEMLDLKRFKKAVISNCMNSPFEEQILNSWAMRNRIISQDQKI